MIELLVALAGEQDDVAGAGALERRLDGRAPVGDDQQVVVAALAGRLRAARDLVEDRVAVLAARVLVGDDDEAGALAGDPAHQRALGRVALPGRAEDRDQPAAAAPRRAGARRSSTAWSEAGLWAKSTMTPNGWPSVDPLHPARARPATEARPSRTAAGSSPSASPRATTASALWTLNRPASRRSSVAAPDGAVVGDPEAAAVLLDAGRADVGGGIGAVGEDPGAGLLGDADERAGRRVVGVDDPGRRPAVRLAGAARPVAAGEPLEQRQLGVAVRLPRAVELEVLVGQVGEDRDVVGDASTRSSARPCEVVSMTAARSPAWTIARSARWSSGASGVVAWASLAAWTPPIRVATVPIIPVRIPAASSARRRGTRSSSCRPCR